MTKDDYFRETLQAITGVEPPAHFRYPQNDKSDEAQMELQDWCSENARPEWSTGIGILEAAELIVDVAIGNGNIEVLP